MYSGAINGCNWEFVVEVGGELVKEIMEGNVVWVECGEVGVPLL